MFLVLLQEFGCLFIHLVFVQKQLCILLGLKDCLACVIRICKAMEMLLLVWNCMENPVGKNHGSGVVCRREPMLKAGVERGKSSLCEETQEFWEENCQLAII